MGLPSRQAQHGFAFRQAQHTRGATSTAALPLYSFSNYGGDRLAVACKPQGFALRQAQHYRICLISSASISSAFGRQHCKTTALLLALYYCQHCTVSSTLLRAPCTVTSTTLPAFRAHFTMTRASYFPCASVSFRGLTWRSRSYSFAFANVALRSA
jgi:hypothetical protein